MVKISTNSKKEFPINWLNIEGIHQVENAVKIGESYMLHPLVIEDIVNVFSRSKIDIFDDYLCIILKTFNFETDSNILSEDQVSLLLTKDCVVSFNEKQSDIFSPIVSRISSSFGKIRKTKNDYWIQWTRTKDDNTAILWAYDPELKKVVEVLRVREK